MCLAGWTQSGILAVVECAGGLTGTTDTHQNQNMKTTSVQDKDPESVINEGEEVWSCSWLATRQSKDTRYERTFTCEFCFV